MIRRNVPLPGLGLALALVVLACRGAQEESGRIDARTCGSDTAPVLTGEGIGALAIGASVDSVRAACVLVRDTSLAQGAEGMPERRFAVLFGPDTVEGTVEGGTIWRIELSTPRIRTPDSLGVGSTLGTLRRQGTKYLGYGEGGPFVQVTRHCGLSFDLQGVPSPHRTYEQIPDTVTVERVLVVGCRGR
jgi:hypothetical protein